MAGYRGDAVIAMQRRMIDAVAALPGVSAVGMIDRPPLGGDWVSTTVFRDETTDLRPQNVAANPALYSVSPDYFRAAGTALLAGRAFSWHDDGGVARVAVVNREFARKLFGSVPSAVGKYFQRRSGRYQVVGVVEEGKHKSLTEDPQPAMFLSILQSPSSGTSLVVRFSGDSQPVAGAIRNTLRGLDSGLPAQIESWNQHLDLVLFPSRVATVALGVLGVMGAMLSITGIFGMAAYAVSKRLRELGIRLALGAQRREVLQAALGRALRLLVVGSAAGLLLGLLSTRVLAMLGLGLFASWIPAQRALTLDPAKLLREE
jgi:ABC-type antimicrobial peptide transport system permease subunit